MVCANLYQIWITGILLKLQMIFAWFMQVRTPVDWWHGGICCEKWRWICLGMQKLRWRCSEWLPCPRFAYVLSSWCCNVRNYGVIGFVKPHDYISHYARNLCFIFNLLCLMSFCFRFWFSRFDVICSGKSCYSFCFSVELLYLTSNLTFSLL